jgi:hypothetical protein
MSTVQMTPHTSCSSQFTLLHTTVLFCLVAWAKRPNAALGLEWTHESPNSFCAPDLNALALCEQSNWRCSMVWQPMLLAAHTTPTSTSAPDSQY